MKKILTVIALLMLVGTMQAQRQVTTFLGIPVDGTKAEMKRKLVAKGFTPKTLGDTDYLEGEFNGAKVHLRIGTNNNKVYRIMVSDANTVDEANIKIRFNTLASQFEANDKYYAPDTVRIDDSVDLSYEMRVKNKVFEAVYYQKHIASEAENEAIDSATQAELAKKFTAEQLANPTDEEEIEIAKTKLSVSLNSIKQQVIDVYKRSVWFRIVDFYGKYFISIYYDNEYNKANGEDL